jgi:hypothetical protein
MGTKQYGLDPSNPPSLGATTVTSLNKITITAPANGATLTLTDGKTLSVSNTITITANDGATLAIGGGGTLGSAAYTATTAYDASGVAAGAVSSHEGTYNHSNYNTAYGWGNHASAGYVSTTPVVTKTGSDSITAAQCKNTFVRITATGTITLPAADTVGLRVMICSTTAAALSVDPASASDYIILNGTALAGGNKVTSGSTAGECIELICDVANYWREIGTKGTWIDGGA